MQKLKKIPRFKNEEQERQFWSDNDSAEYVDYSKTEQASFPDLHPTTKSISIRLPVYLMNRLKEIANKRDIPYQSLIKLYLSEKVEAESSKR